MAIELRRTYVPVQAPNQDELAYNIAKLVIQGVDLAVNDPEKAETSTKACIAVGLVGAGIWVLAQLFK
ncbi:MAG: hypothetical protein ABR909_04805 [Candidatus Bathyarchaeia archaeon]